MQPLVEQRAPEEKEMIGGEEDGGGGEGLAGGGEGGATPTVLIHEVSPVGESCSEVAPTRVV